MSQTLFWLDVEDHQYSPGDLVGGRLHMAEMQGPEICTLFLHCWEFSWTGALDLRAAKRGGVVAFPLAREHEAREFTIRLPRDAQASFRLPHGGVYWTCSAKLRTGQEDPAWVFSGRISVV